MRVLLILAHGQPSDPGPIARALEGFAAQVAPHLPDHQVRAATLAERGALARLADLAPGAVLPLFMAGGWFTREAVPARMKEAGLTGWQMLEPLGTQPELFELGLRVARESGAAEILVAAHGSGRSTEPARIARELAARIAAETGARSEAAFIEQEPRLEGVTGWGPASVCLPFFAMAGAHVTRDLPEALAQAGFAGRILPALGLHPDLPALIAQIVRRAEGNAAAP